MSKVFIEESTLSSIGNAIREKNGTTELIAPLDMAGAISAIEGGGGGYEPADEDLTYNICSDLFAQGKNAWVVRDFGDRIKFDSTSASDKAIFGNYPYEVFDSNPTITKNCLYVPLQTMFSSCSNLKEITGSIRTPEASNNGTNGLYRADYIQSTFASCHRLRAINDNFIDTDRVKTTSSGTNRFSMIFNGCYSLREIPGFIHRLLEKTREGTDININGANYGYGSLFNNCYTLNKIENLWVISGFQNGNTITSNIFANTFDNCLNIHKLTFATNEDGTPKTAKWNNQIIDLTKYFGYTSSSNSYNYINGYNSGITGVGINSPNSFDEIEALQQFYTGEGLTNNYAISSITAKYGHTEAIETINTLPDTSSAGGGNTIKFLDTGFYTDYLKGRTNNKSFDSSISTLTEAEIAIATTKGWTVSIV